MKVNPVRKIFSEVNRAYLAGLLDGDGAIMACIEKHKEKKFGFRVRIYIKISQNNSEIVKWCKSITRLGQIRKNRNEYEWRIRGQEEAMFLLKLLLPYLRVKKNQAKLAKKIVNTKIVIFKDLLKKAQLADTLSKINIRSQGRRKNFMAMIKENISPND